MIKKSLFALAALLGIAVACVEKTPEYEQIVATYYLSTNNTEVISLAANRGKDVNLNVKTRELTGGEANLTFTLKVDMEKVATYNAENQTEYVAMPTEAYTLNKAEIMVPRFNTGSTTVKVTVKAKGLEAGKIYILPVSIDSVKGGNYKLDETAQTVYILLELLADDGSGDSGDSGNTSGGAYEFMQGVYDEKLEPAPASKVPDLTIKTVDDMKSLKALIAGGESKYVVLGNDIDMSSVTDWKPLNEDGAAGAIEFNGNGYTIKNFKCTQGSYRSFFGIMNGRVYNVTFENPEVDGTAGSGTHPCAIIAAYGGHRTGTTTYVYDVKVKGAKLTGKAGGCGGIIGVAVNAMVKRCSFDGTINNDGRRAGGIVGYHNLDGTTGYGVQGFLRIEDCISSGSLTSGQNIGGILGQTQYQNLQHTAKASVVMNCISTMTLVGRNAGGIVGGAAYGGTYPDTFDDTGKSVRDMIVKCIAWNDKIDATSTTNGNYSSGAVVGYCNIYQYFYDCYRKSDMTFICPVAASADNSTTYEIEPVDQPNSGGDVKTLYDGTQMDESSPLYGWKHGFPYHGKAATNASATAKTLGWDETVWDLSGAVPSLK
jgi:hypothetical protein